MDKNQQLYFEILNRIPIEKIKDHPNILVAAGFWDDERYQAARTCYMFMRKLDDLIDDYKSDHKGIHPNDRGKFLKKVEDWKLLMKVNHQAGPFYQELNAAIREFKIPDWPLEAFARSMVYDVNNDGFRDLPTFLEYAEGATVAPSSIFVHLCGIARKDGVWQEPLFDVRSASTPCALFSYLVHIIRDFQKDQLNNLSYFADDRLMANGLTRAGMREIAEGASIPAGFRQLMEEYYALADGYREQTWEVLERIRPLVEPRYYLSLLVIFNLYLMVFERIDLRKGRFTAEELNPSSREIYERVSRTIKECQYQTVNY